MMVLQVLQRSLGAQTCETAGLVQVDVRCGGGGLFNSRVVDEVC